MNGPTIAIFVFDGAEELDWVGPWEVLAAWRDGWPDDDVTVSDVMSAHRAEQTVEAAK